jgi:RNA polymerase sigma factor (sigma-70 family)
VALRCVIWLGESLLSSTEEAEFWSFYRKTGPILFGKAYRMCRGHRADADDAHQQAYLKALEHWPTVSGLADEQRVAWMATTLAREVLQIWRALYRSREGEPYDADEEPETATRDLGLYADAVLAKDAYRRTCRAIACLEGRPGEVIVLHCLAGYEISEVATMLGIKPVTVRAHLHTGRQRLREIMAREEGSA